MGQGGSRSRWRLLFLGLSHVASIVFISLIVSLPDAEAYGSPTESLARAGALRVELIDRQNIAGRDVRYVEIPPEESESAGPALIVFREKDYIQAPFHQIERIRFHRTEDVCVVSDSSSLCYRLAGHDTNRPVPPNWFLPTGETPEWTSVALPSPRAGWFFVPGAAWIWTPAGQGPPMDETALFRSEFNLRPGFAASTARLTVSSTDQVQSLYLNGTPVPIGSESLQGRRMVFDVTHMLKEGTNLLALRARGRVRKGALDAGLAFRIDIEQLPAPDGHPSDPSPGAVVFMVNGDILKGALARLSSDIFLRDTPYGELVIDRDWVETILLNPARLGTSFRRFEEPESAGVPRFPVAFPIVPRPRDSRQGVQMRSGDFITGRLVGLSGQALSVKPRYGDPCEVPLAEVLWMRPNRGGGESSVTKMPDERDYVARVRMTNGDELTGELLSVSNGKLALAVSYTAEPLDAPFDRIIEAHFPYHLKRHAMNKALSRKEGKWAKCAVIGDFVDSRTASPDSSFNRISDVLARMGVAPRYLSPAEMVEPGALDPDAFPLLINIDNREQYYHTVNEEGDGYAALLEYAQGGGSVLHLASGKPFSYGRVAQGGRWVRLLQTGSGSLNELLGFGYVEPGDDRTKGMSFELPPNSNRRFLFRKLGWDSLNSILPVQVEFPPLGDARFRPFAAGSLPEGATAQPIYEMIDDDGARYGTAMAVIRYDARKRPGHVGIYVSYPLFNAEYEGESMLECLLPYAFSLVSAQPRVEKKIASEGSAGYSASPNSSPNISEISDSSRDSTAR